MNTDLSILIRPDEIEHFRKALHGCRGLYQFVTNETPVANGKIHFVLSSNDPGFFFQLGKNFGTIKEFKYDHRERKDTEE